MYELEFNQSFTGGKSVSISEGKHRSSQSSNDSAAKHRSSNDKLSKG